MKEGKFRDDLMYRLQGFLIHLPPLRERENDVINLAKNFLETFCKENGMRVKSLTPGAASRLMSHDWPGNVRELKAVVERAVLLSDSDKIGEDDIVLTGQ